MHGDQRDTIFYTDITMANIVILYGIAGLVSIFVEFPLSTHAESVTFKLFGADLHEST